LAGTPGGDQNVAIVAVEAFDQFHEILSLVAGTQILIAESCCASFVCNAKAYVLFSHETQPNGGCQPSNMVTED
jgi:hypothetical protein